MFSCVTVGLKCDCSLKKETFGVMSQCVCIPEAKTGTAQIFIYNQRYDQGSLSGAVSNAVRGSLWGHVKKAHLPC